MIDDNILANTELFKQNMIDISETNISINFDELNELSESEKLENITDKKKRGRKKKVIEIFE